MAGKRFTRSVLGTPIDAISWEGGVERIHFWADRRQSRYVCLCNVHSVVTARRDPSFARVLDGADMATPDGAPVAWMLRRMGASEQDRINGPDLMWRYFAQAEARGESVYLYGGSDESLAALQRRMAEVFPALRVAGAWSPPYRELTPEEDAAAVERINASGAGTVWVGLGCPKQEQWMAAHRGRINAVMLGVGAAFDYHAGTVHRAPLWMQKNSLEWLHRLCAEPRRLWRRYAFTNSYFVLAAIGQLTVMRLWAHKVAHLHAGDATVASLHDAHAEHASAQAHAFVRNAVAHAAPGQEGQAMAVEAQIVTEAA